MVAEGALQRFEIGVKCLLAVAVLLLASDSVLILSDWCDTWLAWIAWLALLGTSCHGWRRGRLTRAGLLVCLAGFAYVSIRVGHPVARLILISWFFGFLYFLEQRRGVFTRSAGKVACFLVMHLASLAYALALAGYERSDRTWFLLEHIMVAISPAHAPLGIWASGLPIYLLGSILVGLAVVLRRSAAGAIALIGILAAGFAVVQVILTVFTPVTALKICVCQLGSMGLVAILVSKVMAGRDADAKIVVTRGSGPRATIASATGAGGRTRLRSRALAASLALTAAGILCIAESESGSPQALRFPAKPCVALYSEGLLDWEVPSAERAGLLNSGMFGLFRRSLQRRVMEAGGEIVEVKSRGEHANRAAQTGHDRDSIADGTITAELLSSVGLVVFINPTTRPSQDEISMLRHFVESGGGLLVLGDHTNIAGSREALNSVLSFTNIRFNFDSAVPTREHWQGCLGIRRHPVTAGRIWEPTAGCATTVPEELRLQIAVGASLAIESPASPIVVGRYGFADTGDTLNGGPGAFLGNLTHDRDEALGDLVLVAAENIGKGRVVVFGDTSPFQNGALLLSQGFVSNAVGWVLSGGTHSCDRTDQLSFGKETALIDFSLRPAVSLSLFSEASLGGLANCLARMGVVARPAFSRRDWTAEGDYLFIVSPTRVGSTDVERLLDYMESGGNLILSQGYTRPQPCGALLDRLGFAIENVPLGNGAPNARITHKDAWALAWAGCESAGQADGTAAAAVADTTVLASAFGYPTIVTRRYGKGSFTLVGDGRFFLDGNLEGERNANSQNIVFVGELIDRLKRGVAYASQSEN